MSTGTTSMVHSRFRIRSFAEFADIAQSLRSAGAVRSGGRKGRGGTKAHIIRTRYPATTDEKGVMTMERAIDALGTAPSKAHLAGPSDHVYEDGECVRCGQYEACRPVQARTVARGRRSSNSLVEALLEKLARDWPEPPELPQWFLATLCDVLGITRELLLDGEIVHARILKSREIGSILAAILDGAGR